jgi:uncharacterized membrane protein YbhN (UPF0104 family)
MKKILTNLLKSNWLKFGVAAALICWLLHDASQKPEFTQLLQQPKDWRLFGLAFVLFFGGVCLTFIRWHALVRALDFPFTLHSAFRLGFLGYLFNFVAPGGVGGDLFKAVFIAREYHGRRAQAVATVVIDRIIGLYALFVVAAGSVLYNDLLHSPSEAVRDVAIGTLIGTGVGAIGIVMLLIPGFTNGRFSQFLSNLPRTGRIFRQLLDAVRMYRARLGSVAMSLVYSVGVHLLTVFGFYVLGMAIPGSSPTLAEHFVIVPLAMVVSAVPVTPGGLGTFELSLEKLFPTMSAAVINPGRGLLVALVYRIITIVTAMVGFGFYLASRREVSDVMHEAEHEAEAEATP